MKKYKPKERCQVDGCTRMAVRRTSRGKDVCDIHAFQFQTRQPTSKEPGRNDDCYCGSGKKYKKCHGVGK